MHVNDAAPPSPPLHTSPPVLSGWLLGALMTCGEEGATGQLKSFRLPIYWPSRFSGMKFSHNDMGLGVLLAFSGRGRGC